MKLFQIETWARRVIDRVEKNQPNEDFQVELKAEWPEADRKTARRIAAHANTARGEPILWLIGVDQKSNSVTGVEQRDIAKWYQQIQAEFDEHMAPSLRDLNLEYNGKTIVALLLETERFPYVVKSKDDFLEVPWRDGTRTRSAKRSDLIKLLIPIENQPSIEVLSAGIKLLYYPNERPHYHLATHICVYIEPSGENPITIPFHRCEKTVIFTAMGSEQEVRLEQLRFSVDEKSPTIDITDNEVLVHGAGKVCLYAFANLEDVKLLEDPKIKVTTNLSRSIQPMVINVENLVRHKETEDGHLINEWRLGNALPS